MLRPINIEATTLGDAWFQLVYYIFNEEYSHRWKIDRGSYAGQDRIEYIFASIMVSYPDREPRIPEIPEHLNIPPPTTREYVNEYFSEYLLKPEKLPNEDYRYSERIWSYNQVNKVIDMLKKTPKTNHAVLRVTQPSDIDLADPPCLQQIIYKYREGCLWCYPYFRSWDLWNGFPNNLAGIQLLTDFVLSETGYECGPMIAASCGLHIYDHHEEVVKLRLYRS